MAKVNKLYIVIILLLLTVWIVLQHFVPQPVNWQLSFSGEEKTPYGCFVFREMLDELNGEKELTSNFAGFYTNPLLNQLNHSTLVVVSENFDPDSLEIDQLLQYATQGNTVFISALYFDPAFQKKMGFTLGSSNLHLFKEVMQQKTDTLLIYPAGSPSPSTCLFKKTLSGSSFTELDTAIYTSSSFNSRNEAKLIHRMIGSGEIYLHSEPLALTNYHILYSNREYANLLALKLPRQNILWDNWYKPKRVVNTSPMRFILSEPALRTGYYLILLGLLLYLIFGSKRRQRVIPAYTPPQNTSLDFIRTLGDLYLRNRDHSDLAQKKTTYLWEFIRERYLIKVQQNNAETARHLSQKSGIRQEAVQELLQLSFELNQHEAVSLKELKELNQHIEYFYKNCL